MRTSRLSLVGTVILALLGGLGSITLAQSEDSDPMAFPTGTFVSVEDGDLILEFNEYGTGRRDDRDLHLEIGYTYATNGDLYTEMTFDYAFGPHVPATYYWDFDGEHLTFELWGEDLEEHRHFMYADNTWTLVEDPVEVVVAIQDIPAGYAVFARPRIVPADQVVPDALTSVEDVLGNLAAVDIAAGQLITPDLLKPPAE
jgi:hypothetical protein